MKSISVQELAETLRLSRVTIWKVLNNKPGVAPQTVRRVYELLNDSSAIEKLHQKKNITLITTKMDSSVFWSCIVDQIASILNKLDITITYYPIAAMGMSYVTLDSIIQHDKTDGLIVLNVYDKQILTTLAHKGFPSVYLDSIPGFTATDLKGDLMLLEGVKTVCTITEQLISAGCNRIGFIGETTDAISNADRFKGFESAMGKKGLYIDPAFCLTSLPDPDLYKSSIMSFLNSLSQLPDAFVCVNDYIAFLMRTFLADRAEKIPILTGYDNANEFMLDHYGVTTVNVQNEIIGKRMVNQIMFRLENPEADLEEITIIPKIIFR